MPAITVELPFPPSTNRLWRHGRGNTYKSAEYVKWIKEADGMIYQQKFGPIKTLPGKFTALLELYTSDGRRRKDADNRMKAPLDYATRIGFILDDQYCEKGTFAWVSSSQAPSSGCRLTLTPLDAPPRLWSVK